MTNPEHVPMAATDRVRPSERLELPRPWRPDRPGDLAELRPPAGLRFGSTGPDAGYGMLLARRFVERLDLGLDVGAAAAADALGDAVAGCFACGSHRAAAFGRAPVIYDMEWAYTLWGCLGGAPADLVAFRTGAFRGVAHHYWDQRRVVDAVRPQSLTLTPAEVRERLADWPSLLVVEPGR